MNTAGQKIAVFWHRRDLRVEDNVGLYNALKSGLPVQPLFIFDTNILGKLDDLQDRRVDFIHQTLTELQHTFTAQGSSLLVKHGEPMAVWQSLVAELNIAAVYVNHDYEPYARKRDTAIGDWLSAQGIKFHTFKDQVIFEKEDILTSQGTPYNVFTPYRNAWRDRLGPPDYQPRPSEALLDRLVKTGPHPFPELKEIGFKKNGVSFPAKKLREEIVQNYHNTRNFPARDGTSRLSVHLRFGTVSIRRLVEKALKLNDTWLNELIWREFFMMILWHYPHTVNRPFREKYASVPWRQDEGDFRRWCQGITGYPMVDAGMRELNRTGIMHNRVRMVTAGFLTRHLFIDWRWGERYFAKKLLDFDLSANVGNWQWAAGCGCDAAPYFRIFNPTTQIKKFDPDYEYIKKWVPELGTAEYPEPIVAHKAARQRALDTFKKALGG